MRLLIIILSVRMCRILKKPLVALSIIYLYFALMCFVRVVLSGFNVVVIVFFESVNIISGFNCRKLSFVNI